jgi:hypothetical protein
MTPAIDLTTDEGFGRWVEQSGSTVVVSTYQAGKLLLVGHDGRQISVNMRDMPGFTRGLCLVGKHALVGLSRIRESKVFGGLAIAAYLPQLVCGVAIVSTETRQGGGEAAVHRGLRGDLRRRCPAGKAARPGAARVACIPRGA